ncbi:MAG: hypothetical protein Alis3KO_01060 [Aliiglaciecola sp.]
MTFNFPALNQYIRENQHREFAWGTFDCCMFACDAVLALTDIDPAPQYRNQYTTQFGATRMLLDHADGTLEGAFKQVFGPFKSRLNACRGDIVLIEQDNEKLVGIVNGVSVWTVGKLGLVNVSFSQVLGAWDVTKWAANYG